MVFGNAANIVKQMVWEPSRGAHYVYMIPKEKMIILPPRRTPPSSTLPPQPPGSGPAQTPLQRWGQERFVPAHTENMRACQLPSSALISLPPPRDGEEEGRRAGQEGEEGARGEEVRHPPRRPSGPNVATVHPSFAAPPRVRRGAGLSPPEQPRSFAVCVLW